MVAISWKFTESEIREIQAIVDEYQDNPFVTRRIEQNVDSDTPDVSPSRFWQAHLIAQLTSQQRSGPESAVSQFLLNERDRLSLDRCRAADDVQNLVAETLEEYGGIRFHRTIGEACEINLQRLEQDDQAGWAELQSELERLQRRRAREPEHSDADIEREICRFLYEGIQGEGLHRIGPKQSRNLLQALGLTRFETPLDSRISKWLNKNLDLPYHLSAGGLSESEFYDFHMDLIQEGCREADLLPCVFDAAVFTSYSPDWPEEGSSTMF
jgi:hypothetical protein